MGRLERESARRCADALAALQAVSVLLRAGDGPPAADPALRLMAAVEAVQVAERATHELRALLVEQAIGHGVAAAAVGRDADE